MKRKRKEEEEFGDEVQDDYLKDYTLNLMPSTPTIEQISSDYSAKYEYSFIPSFDEPNDELLEKGTTLSCIIGNHKQFLNLCFELKQNVRIRKKELSWNHSNHSLWPHQIQKTIFAVFLLHKKRNNVFSSLEFNLLEEIICRYCEMKLEEWIPKIIISKEEENSLKSCKCDSLPFFQKCKQENEQENNEECECFKYGRKCNILCSCFSNCGNENGRKEVLMVSNLEEAENWKEGRKMHLGVKNDIPFQVASPLWCFVGSSVSFFDTKSNKMKEGIIRKVKENFSCLISLKGNQQEIEIESFNTKYISPNSKNQKAVLLKRGKSIPFGSMVIIQKIFLESNSAKVKELNSGDM